MRYKIFYKGVDRYTIITENAYELIVGIMRKGTSTGTDNFYITEKNQTINLNDISCIEPEETIEGAQSGVITPPTLSELKRREEEKRQEIISSPTKLVDRIKQKANQDE
jgi:hypothetical protein